MNRNLLFRELILIGIGALLGLALFNVAHADERTCNLDTKPGSDCEVVKTLTRCDVSKMALKRKIYELEKKVKELEAKSEKRVEPVIIHEVRYRDFERRTIKHNILSLYTTRDISGISTNQQGASSSAVVQTMFEPGIKYQYEFNFGLVPEVGINVNGNPLFGLGFEF